MFRKDFIKGICHSRGGFEGPRECGFNWMRPGIAFPYDEKGELSEKYLAAKERLKRMHDEGFKTMAITPNPGAFEAYGVKTHTAEGLKQVEDIINFMVTDCKGLVDGWQISNEMNVYFFRAPLNYDQSIEFVLAGLKGAKKADEDVLLGYNFSEFSESSEYMTRKLLANKELYNYMGYDGYYGTWIPGKPEEYGTTIERIHEITGLPVILQEFGFASSGDVIQGHELNEYVQSIGFKDFEEAKSNAVEFLNRIPARMADMVRTSPKEDWKDNIWLLESHLVRKWLGGSDELPHTLQGQADYYERVLPTLAKQEHLMGMFVFSWRDAGRCFFCLEEDCPCETAWGLNDNAGNPKPAYHVVKKYLNIAV